MIKDGINESGNETLAFLMVGQSNMAGRGDAGEVAPIDNEMCTVLRMGRWQRMREPINADRGVFEGSPKSGVSLAASFADDMSRALGRKIGLIPAADGGTSINLWQPGRECYEYAVMIAEYAKKNAKIAGIIWHQGESDSPPFGKEMPEEEYGEKFMATMSGFRSALGNPELPIVIGEIPREVFEDPKGPAKMNALLGRLAGVLPNCRIASSEGLSIRPDNLHFDSRSLRILGKRYAEKMLELMKK